MSFLLRIPKIAYRITFFAIIGISMATSLYYISNKIYDIFIRCEEEMMVQNVYVVEGILNREMNSISILTKDWTMWTDMYDYVSNPNNEFAESEMMDETFQEVNVNIVSIYNKDKGLLFSKHIEKESNIKTVPQNIQDDIKKNLLLDFSDEAAFGKYILNIGSKKLLLVSHQVTRSDGSGPPVGWVIFGHYLQNESLNEFKYKPGFYFNIYPQNPQEIAQLSSMVNEQTPLYVNLENERRIVAISLIDLFSPNSKYVLQVEQVPIMYSMYTEAMIFISLFFLGLFLGIIALTILLIKLTCKAPDNAFQEKISSFIPLVK